MHSLKIYFHLYSWLDVSTQEGVIVRGGLTGMDYHTDFEVSSLLAGAEYSGEVLLFSARLKKAYELVQRVAPYNATVLINGESGTGKELIASALHRGGPNPLGPFVALNSANLVGPLAESQLFGHVRGAFTDAHENSLGYFRAAQGGTLFLDEIGELPLELQPKLLRAVENREVQAVGAYQASRVDLRLVAATNRNLRSMVAARTFREDLYYRLNAISITVPPLRDCRDGIAMLCAHFVKIHSRQAEKAVTHISSNALAILQSYEWPGNVRELNHAIQSAVLMTEDARIDAGDLPAQLLAHESSADDAEFDSDLRATTPLADTDEGGGAIGTTELATMTREALLRSLESTRGNRQQAAKILGISRQKLYRMIARYDLAQVGRLS
jgi:transcriptional regulator with PAS, ATPase and Fis domain